MGMWSSFSLASSAQAALSWPLPPSMRIRLGSLENDSSEERGEVARGESSDCGMRNADWGLRIAGLPDCRIA
jgi:hypothetical protein